MNLFKCTLINIEVSFLGNNNRIVCHAKIKVTSHAECVFLGLRQFYFKFWLCLNTVWRYMCVQLSVLAYIGNKDSKTINHINQKEVTGTYKNTIEIHIGLAWNNRLLQLTTRSFSSSRFSCSLFCTSLDILTD